MTGDRLAVVTGGSSGIGEGIAKHLANEGWHIAVSDIAPEERLGSLKQYVEDLDLNFFYQYCDVSSQESVESFFENVYSLMGKVPTLLVNNAGVQTWAGLLDLEEKDWDKVINTNLKGSFINTQMAAKKMVEAGVGGSIINIGSGCNTQAFPKLVDYSASKGGVEMLTKVAAVELGEHNIRVNCVAPGGILIERTKQESDDYEKVWSKLAPLNRVGVPADIANAVSFFASDKASFVTGQTLYVDGGAYSKANWPY